MFWLCKLFVYSHTNLIAIGTSNSEKKEDKIKKVDQRY